MRKMQKAKIYGAFYSPERILSYGRHWLFVCGSRSIGKSTGWAMYLLTEFLKKGYKFIYCRRTDDEVQETCKEFFNSAVEILNSYGYKFAFRYEFKTYFIKREGCDEWEACGISMDVNGEQKSKSKNFNGYKYLLYDEFISMKNQYLGGQKNPLAEYRFMLSLYGTIDRDINKAFLNETVFIFLGNLASFFNPFFIGLDVHKYINMNNNILGSIIAPKGEQWAIEFVDPKDIPAVEEYKSSVLYKLSDESYKNYAYENIVFDSSTFIGKTDEPRTALIDLAINGEILGVYTLKRSKMIYISKDITHLRTLALTNEDHKIDFNLCLNSNKNPYLKLIKEAYELGQVLFENSKIKMLLSNYYMFTK